MADTYTTLNPGVGGDSIDEEEITYGSAPTTRKRSRVVISGAARLAIAPILTGAPAQTEYGLVVRNIPQDNTVSGIVTVQQPTHDNLNLNATLQIANADVSNSNPVPVSDAGSSLTVDAPATAPLSTQGASGGTGYPLPEGVTFDQAYAPGGATRFTPLAGHIHDVGLVLGTEGTLTAIRATSFRSLHVALRDPFSDNALGLPDDVAFSNAPTVVPAGFVFDDTSPNLLDEGDAGAARISARRELYAQIRDAAGNERGVDVTASHHLRVVVSGDNTLLVDGSGVTQPISAASLPLPAGAATAALQLPDGHNVTIDNASGAAAVNIQDGGNSVTVDAPATAPVSVQGSDGAVGYPLPAGALIDQVFTPPDTVTRFTPIAGHYDDTAPYIASENTLQPIRATFWRALHTNLRAALSDTPIGIADDAAYSDASAVIPAGFVFDDASPDLLDEGDAGAARVSARRELYTQLRDAAGNERGANVTASHHLRVVVSGDNTLLVDGSGATQPISAASLPLPTGAATAALQLPDGHNVTVDNGSGAAAVNVQDGGNSLTVDNAALSVVGGGTQAGAMRVTVASDSTGVLSVDDNGSSLTVDAPATAPVSVQGTNGSTGYPLPEGVLYDQVFTPAVPTRFTPIAGHFDDANVNYGTEDTLTAIRATFYRALHVTLRSDFSNSSIGLPDDVLYSNAPVVLPAGFLFNDVSPDLLDEGDAGAARVSARRELYTQIRDAAGNERGADVTASHHLQVVVSGSNTLLVDGSGVTQPISAASLPLPTGAATAALQLPDGHNVTIDNAGGGAAVNVQDGGNSLTVDAPVGTPVPVGVTTTADVLVKPGDNVNNAIRVNVVAGSAGGTEFNEDAQHSSGAAGSLILGVRYDAGGSLVDTDIDYAPLQFDSSGRLRVVTQGASGGTSSVDDAAFTPAVDSGTPAMGLLDDSGPDSVNEGDVGVLRMSANRNLYTNIRDGGGTEVGAGVTASHHLQVVVSGDNTLLVDGSGVTQPVSAASLPLPTGAATAALQLPDGHNVTVDNAGGAAAVNIQDGGNAITVDGTVTADPGTGDFNLAPSHTRNEAFKEAIAIGGELDDATPVAATEGNVSPSRITAQRALHTNLRNDSGTEVGTAGAPLRVDPTGSTTQPVSGTVAISTFPDNEPFNMAQVGGVATSTGAGAVNTGTQRVTIATDDVVTVDNAGTFAVQDSQKLADNAPFTDGTTPVQPIGAIFDEVAGTALTENDIAAPRIDSKRALVLTIEDETTRGRRATVTVANALKVDGSAVTQPISATGLPLPTGAATAALQLPDGHNVTVDNAAGAAAVNVQDGGNSLTVDAPVGTPVASRLSDGTAFLTTTGGRLSVDGSGVTQPVSGTVTAAQATAGSLNAQVVGDVAHDGADSTSNPVKIGLRAIAHGTNPTAVAAADRTNWYANRAGVPFMIGGHPKVVTTEYVATTARTNDPIITIGAGLVIVVTEIEALLSNATTVNVGVRVGFGATVVPAEPADGASVDGVVLSHPGIAPGSGIVRGTGAGILGVGADGEDLRITNDVPTSGRLRVLVSYYTIES